MKNKKAQLLLIIPLLYILGAIILSALLVWFGFRISDGITSIITFLTTWWWAILLIIFGVLYKDIIAHMLLGLFKKIGI